MLQRHVCLSSGVWISVLLWCVAYSTAIDHCCRYLKEPCISDIVFVIVQTKSLYADVKLMIELDYKSMV